MEVGDKVRIVVYGELHKVEACASCGRSTDQYKDVMPNIVGKEGVIDEVKQNNGYVLYSLSGIPEKSKWYNSEQLTKI